MDFVKMVSQKHFQQGQRAVSRTQEDVCEPCIRQQTKISIIEKTQTQKFNRNLTQLKKTKEQGVVTYFCDVDT